MQAQYFQCASFLLFLGLLARLGWVLLFFVGFLGLGLLFVIGGYVPIIVSVYSGQFFPKRSVSVFSYESFFVWSKFIGSRFWSRLVRNSSIYSSPMFLIIPSLSWLNDVLENSVCS